MRLKVLLFSKSKRTTEATKNLLAALKRHGLVKKTKWLNYSKLKSFAGKNAAEKIISWTIGRYRPHLTIVNNRDARVPWLKKCKKYGIVSCVYHDCNVPLKDKAIELGRECDFFYLSNKFQLSEYRSKGVNATYLCRGCSSDVHYPVGPRQGKYKSEVAFIGKPRPGIRAEILRTVEKNFDLKVWGLHWKPGNFKRIGSPVNSKEYRIVCASAKIVLGINDGRVVDSFEQLKKQGGFTSNRDRLVMGCGGFFLTNYSRGLEELYEIGKHFDVYRNLEELVEKISYYLKHPEKRSEIAFNGCSYVHWKETFDHFARRAIKDARDKLPGRLNLFNSS